MPETDSMTGDTGEMLGEAWDALGGDAGDLRLVRLEGDPAGLFLMVIFVAAGAIGCGWLATIRDAPRPAIPGPEVLR